MKHFTISILITLIHLNISAQLIDYSQSNEIENSASITSSRILDTDFEKSIIYKMSSGATIFNQETYLFQIDRNTLEVINTTKIESDSLTSFMIMPGKDRIYFPSYYIDKEKEKIHFYCKTLDENLETKTQTKECYSEAIRKPRNCEIVQNESKSLILFTYHQSYKKKEDKSDFHYAVFNENMELISSNVVKGNHKDRLKQKVFSLYEDGVIYIDFADKSILNIVNVRTDTKYTIQLTENKVHFLEKYVQLSNGNILIVGTYSDDKVSEGIFSAEIKANSNKLINYTDTPLEIVKPMKRKPKFFDFHVLEDGSFFCLTSDMFIADSYTSMYNYRLYYINIDGDSWIQDMPISTQKLLNVTRYGQNLEVKAFINNGTFCMVYNDVEKAQKLNIDDFSLETAKFGNVSLVKPEDNMISVLTVNKSKEMNREMITPKKGEFLNGNFSSYNETLYTPCRYFTGSTWNNTSIYKFKFNTKN